MINFNKIKEDDGNAAIILGIMLIVVTLMIGAMLLDITKAFQMKSAYNDAAQKAAQAAIRHQNTEGFLKAEAVGEAVMIYENVTRKDTIKDGYMSSCPELRYNGERNVKITIRAMKDKFELGREFTIESRNVKPTDTAETIIAKIPGLRTRSEKDIFEQGKFLGIEIELKESTPNVILPNTSVIAGVGDKLSVQCQKLGVRAGASQYIGRQGVYD